MSADSQPAPIPGEVTVVLQQLARGEAGAGDRLLELLSSELHQMARDAMRRERPDHSLQATALVNEAWMRMARSRGTPPENRRHFLGIAARAMRSVLVDHARRGRSLKRGGGELRCSLPEDLVDTYSRRAIDLVELDDALERLAAREARLARVVELRFFAGLTIAETAEVLELATATVERDWQVARIWLRDQLGDGSSEGQ